jgi:hypothetical protein
LGIPAEVFLQKTGGSFPRVIPHIEWHLFPLKEMSKRGWIHPIMNALRLPVHCILFKEIIAERMPYIALKAFSLP